MPLSLNFPSDNRALIETKGRWRGCSAETVAVPSGEPYEFAYAGDQHYLALHDLRLADGELHVDTLSIARGKDLRGTLTFAPKGCKLSGWARPEVRNNSFTAIYFDSDVLHEELEAKYRERDLRPAVYVRDASLQATLGKLRFLLNRPAVDALLAETLCLTSALEVFAIIATPDGGRLTDRQMARVRAFVDEYLDQPISLSDLAAVVGLSRYHFSRAFKATTGQSPYRFVATLRVEAAARLLRSSDVSLDVIAASVGFPSAAQLRRSFQDRMGVTPHAFRRQER